VCVRDPQREHMGQGIAAKDDIPLNELHDLGQKDGRGVRADSGEAKIAESRVVLLRAAYAVGGATPFTRSTHRTPLRWRAPQRLTSPRATRGGESESDGSDGPARLALADERREPRVLTGRWPLDSRVRIRGGP
jgi:hypothetical protein